MRTTFVLFIFSLSAFSQTFLESVKPNFEPISYSDLKTKIIEHAEIKDGFLSVGESHLEQESVNAINFDLIKTYAEEKNGKAVFCAESIGHFLKPFEEQIKSMTSKYKIYYNNGPTNTDFRKCRQKRKSHILYSGFFHQYRFAKSFPAEFTRLPVVVQEDNNILYQMNPSQGIFVTNMEMEYMEFTAMRAILISSKNADELRTRATDLAVKASLINDSMELLYETGNPFTAKYGVVVSGDAFDADLNGENNYFLLTNLSYRRDGELAKAINAIASWSTEGIEKLIYELKNSKNRVSSVFLGPTASGDMGRITYPGVEQTFEGGSFYIHTKSERGNVLRVIERTSEQFKCFDMDNEGTAIPCF